MTRRIESFAECERHALIEALMDHIDFMLERLEDPEVTGEYRAYIEHSLMHCQDLLDEFNGTDDLHARHPAHQVLQ